MDTLILLTKLEIWNLIYNLGKTIDKPWSMFSDFNEILHLAENRGGRSRPKKQMSDFWEVLAQYELRDLGYVRHPFT